MIPSFLFSASSHRRFTIRALAIAAAICGVLSVTPREAVALERLCDPAFEDCREPLIRLIDQETVRTWFRAHPTITVVSRDRAEGYASAVTQGIVLPRVKALLPPHNEVGSPGAERCQRECDDKNGGPYLHGAAP